MTWPTVYIQPSSPFTLGLMPHMAEIMNARGLYCEATPVCLVIRSRILESTFSV